MGPLETWVEMNRVWVAASGIGYEIKVMGLVFLRESAFAGAVDRLQNVGALVGLSW